MSRHGTAARAAALALLGFAFLFIYLPVATLVLFSLHDG